MDAGFLLLVELRKEEYLDDVILALTETGADEAVVVDAMSMQRLMAFDLPIFAGFREELTAQPGYAKLVVSRSASADVIGRMLQALADGGTDFQGDGVGRIMLLPLVGYVDGHTRIIPEEDRT